mgnify:CR=1 FL=1
MLLVVLSDSTLDTKASERKFRENRKLSTQLVG